MLPNSKCGIFLSCLHFAVLNSLYSEVILKPKQVICLEKIFLDMDILATLPTGYGKSLIFCLIPALIFAKKNGVKCSRRISYGGPQVSRHKEEPHGTNKNVTAQTRTSRHKQEPHGTNKNLTAQTKASRHKQTTTLYTPRMLRS